MLTNTRDLAAKLDEVRHQLQQAYQYHDWQGVDRAHQDLTTVHSTLMRMEEVPLPGYDWA